MSMRFATACGASPFSQPGSLSWPPPRPPSLQQFEGQLFSAAQNFSPFNVVAWHGEQGTRFEWPGMVGMVLFGMAWHSRQGLAHRTACWPLPWMMDGYQPGGGGRAI